MPRRAPPALTTVVPSELAERRRATHDQATSRPRPTAASDRRQAELRQTTLRRSLVTHASVEIAKSRAFASLVEALDQRVRPEGLSDAEWACVCVRDARPGTPGHIVAMAMCCEVADRAEGRAVFDQTGEPL